jgi:hypothetical protein
MGMNSSQLPWQVPTDDIPLNALSQADGEKLEQIFCSHNNKNLVLKWSIA